MGKATPLYHIYQPIKLTGKLTVRPDKMIFTGLWENIYVYKTVEGRNGRAEKGRASREMGRGEGRGWEGRISRAGLLSN